MKTLIASTLLFFAISIQSYAQTKYEFGTLAVFAQARLMGLTLNGEFEKIKLEKVKDPLINSSAATKKLKELGKDNWEVYSVTHLPFDYNSTVLYYHLRREIK